ncbi:MAG: ribonuclease HII [Ruminococcaceae bacterium]|nr:ribonuclease HII [Oscillospiraceae bacterium]
MKEIENELYAAGFEFVAGVDEAGRGPLAGPVCAAAVILPKDAVIEGVNDSKKLSAKKRDMLFDEIRNVAIAYAIEFVYPDVIDDINIRQATALAMHNAVENLKQKADFIIIDGNDNIPYDTSYRYVIKGDAKSQTIAAASILAKVSRDRLMEELDEKYPEYGFKKHKGYGTKVHMEAIQKYGVTEVHRKSFMTAKVLGREV